jgi:hypothetical protein
VAISAALAACSDVRVNEIVPAGRSRRIAIKSAQIRVDPVRAAAGRRTASAGGYRQIGRRDAEPLLGLFAVHRGLHEFAYFHAGENQVVLDLRLGEAQVLQPVVAHVTGGMAVQAVIDEQLGAVLQRSEVV